MVEAVTGTMETIRISAVEEDGIEFFQINDTVLEVLPTDIMSFSDNAVYEESFIRSKAVFAFRSKQSRGKIIVTYPISMHPLAHQDDKEFSTQRDGLRILNQLNKYPFCFIKSARVRGYLSSRAKISSTDFMMFAIDELNIVFDMRVPDVLFAEIHLIYNDHTSQTADFTFYHKDENGQVYSVINPTDSGIFKKAFNFDFDNMFSNFQDMLEKMYEGGVYGENGTPLQSIVLHAPNVFHNTQQSMAEFEEELTKLRQEGMVKEVKVLSKNGNNSFTANFLTEFNDPTSTNYSVTRKEGDVLPSVDSNNTSPREEAGLSNPEDDAQSVYIYWTAFHDLSFNGNSAVKSVKISIKNKLAQQYVGSKKYPFNQYLGKYPARMDIALDFTTSEIYKEDMSGVLSALGQLNNVLDYNTEMFPEIGAYNVIRVSSIITELLGLRSVVPNQTYITASSSNQGVESVNISFIEAEVEEFMDMAKVVQGRYSTNQSSDIGLQTKVVLTYLKALVDGPNFRDVVKSLDKQGKAYASNITVSLGHLVKSGLKEFYRGVDPETYEKQTVKTEEIKEAYDELTNDKTLQKVRAMNVDSLISNYRWPLAFDNGFYGLGSLSDAAFALSPVNMLSSTLDEKSYAEQIANSNAVRETSDLLNGAEFKSDFFQTALDLISKRNQVLADQKKMQEDAKKAKEEGKEAPKYTGSVLNISFKEQGAVNQKISSIYYDIIALSKLDATFKTLVVAAEEVYKKSNQSSEETSSVIADVIKYTGTNITDLNMQELEDSSVSPFFYLMFEPYFTPQKLISLYNNINKDVLDQVGGIVKAVATEQDSSWDKNSGAWSIFDETGIDKSLTYRDIGSEFFILGESDAVRPNVTGSYGSVGNSSSDASLDSARPPVTTASQKANQMKIYNAFKANGFGETLSRAFTAEIGREGGYNTKNWYTRHRDPASDKLGREIWNLGVISWNQGRDTNLIKFMKSKPEYANLVKDENHLVESDKTLEAQVAFIRHELNTSHKKAGNTILGFDPNGSISGAMDAIGRNYIAWRIDDPEFRSKGISNRNSFLKMLEKQLGASAGTTTKAMLNTRATLAGEHLKPNAKLTDEILSKDYQLIKVSVQDGDTLIYDKTGPKHPSLGDKSEIRFQFLDTPETSHRNGNEKDIKNQEKASIEYETVAQPWGVEATNALKAIIKASGGQVWVPKKIPSDYYDRGITTFYTSNTRENITEIMMRAGHGGVWQFQQGGGDAWLNSLIAIQNEARKAKKGMWSTSVTPQNIETFKATFKDLNTALIKTKTVEEADKVFSSSARFKNIVKGGVFKYNGKTYTIGSISKGKGTTETKTEDKAAQAKKFSSNNVNHDIAYTGNQSVNPSSQFGYRKGPNGNIHYGIDFAVTGQAKALAGGTVYIGSNTGYGRNAYIDHGFGLITLVGHLSSFNPGIKHGMRIEYGQILGTIGGSNKLKNGVVVDTKAQGGYGIHLHQETIVKTRTDNVFNLPRIHPFATRSLREIEQEFKAVNEKISAAGGSASIISKDLSKFDIKRYLKLDYLNHVTAGAQLSKEAKIWTSGQDIVSTGKILGVGNQGLTSVADVVSATTGAAPKPEYMIGSRQIPSSSSVYYEQGATTLHCYNMSYNQTQALNLAFPVIKAYLVIGSEVEDPYIGGDIKLNYYFELDGIKDFSLVCNNDDNPVDLALFKIANPSFIKTDLYAVAGKYVKRDLTAVNTYDEVSFIGNRVKINPGTKLHIRLGAGNDPNNLKTVFNGVVTEVGLQDGICLDVIAEGYGRELLLDQLNPGKPDSVGATTPFVFAKAISDADSIYNFGNRSKAIKAVLTYLPGTGDITNHDYSDPETKRLTTRYISNLPVIHEAGNWRQRVFTNIYAAEIERLHNQYSGTIGQFFSILNPLDSDNSSINQNWGTYKYLFYGQTPWKAMKEMEYRHPGTLVKPLMYQDRMTMFFGIKEQMYIARDLDPTFMARCGNKTNDDAATGSVAEYMKHRNKRFDLVTGFHLASSDLNILTNTIKINNNFKTGVKVTYFDTPYDMVNKPEEHNEFKMLSDDSLAAWDIRIGSLVMPGIHEKYSAFMYGTTYLKKEAEKMYGGTITLTGNPCIKAGDYIYINDNLRRLEGVMKVRECKHFLNERVGYITEITPGLFVEPRNFIYSVLFLRLAFVSKIALATATLSASIASNDEVDFQTYMTYLENLKMYSWNSHPNFLSFKGFISTDSKFVYEGGYMGIASAALATLGAVTSYYAVKGGVPKIGGLLSAVTTRAEISSIWQSFKASRAATSAAKSASAANKLTILQATRQALSTFKGAWSAGVVKSGFKYLVSPVTRGLWHVATKSLSMATSLLSGMMTSNPAGWIIRIFWSLAVAFVQAKMQENELTRQPLMLFPLAYNGKPFVAGLSGFEYDSYFEAKMKIFEKNVKELDKAAYLTNVMSNKNLFSSLRGWISKGYEKDIIADINSSFEKVVRTRQNEVSE